MGWVGVGLGLGWDGVGVGWDGVGSTYSLNNLAKSHGVTWTSWNGIIIPNDPERLQAAEHKDKMPNPSFFGLVFLDLMSPFADTNKMVADVRGNIKRHVMDAMARFIMAKGTTRLRRTCKR